MTPLNPTPEQNSAEAEAPRLSIIIPAYNEAERIGPTMEAIATYIHQQPYVSEVLLVDDGSSDDTSEQACLTWHGPERMRILRQEPNQGKGAAIQRGMLEARGEWRLFTDADNSTPIEMVERLWPHANKGVDVCIASRAVIGSDIQTHQPFCREMMGRCFNGLVRALTVSGIHDTQCGFKMFSARAAEAIFPRLRLSDWAFDVECLMLARGLGFSIAEIPVVWINNPATRVSALRDSLKMFYDLWSLRQRYGKNGSRLRAPANHQENEH